MATDLCLSVLKFSHATGVRSDNTIPWTHLQASDIFLVVKGKDTEIADGRLSLRVVHGNTVLESLDVAHYIDAAIEARHGAEKHGVTPQVEQLPIFGITKESLLAIRYRPNDGQARRLQLRMNNPADCRRVVDAFISRGMEFQEQRPRTARPGTGRPTTASQPERLLMANSSSPYFEPTKSALRPSPFYMEPVEAGSLSRKPPASPERLPTHETSQYGQSTAYSQEMPPPSLLSRDEVMAPREVVAARPSTAQIYRSYTTPSQPLLYEAQDVPRKPSDSICERPSSTSHVSTPAAIREAVEDEPTPPRTAVDMPPPTLRTFHTNEQWSSGTPEPSALTAHSSELAEPRPLTARPSTSATTALPDTWDHELPPRRELPFKRPDSRHSGSGQGSSRPGSSALVMPPLPKPKLVKEGSGSPVRADSLSPMKETRPGTASPLKRSFNAVDEEAVRPLNAMGSSKATRPSASRDTSQIKQARTADRTTSPDSTARKPPPMEELLYGRKPLSDRSTNARVPRTNSLADAPHENISPPTSPPKAANAPATYDPTANAFAALRAQPQDPREVTVDEYATQSLQDRQAALDEFMVENLENPAFTKLCEDVENCWRRIALGL